MNRKLLVVELWGIGDLSFSTLLLQEAFQHEREVHLLAKPHAEPLLAPSFPKLKFWSYDAPWTRFTGKYDLWNWNWKRLQTLVGALRAENFDLAVSVRNDPRDHLLMLLLGARQRIGFPHGGSGVFLSQSLPASPGRHKVEDWQIIGEALGYKRAFPHLQSGAYVSTKIAELFKKIGKPVLCLHTGARIPVRRWKETFFAEIIGRLRGHYDFHLLLIPELDGYGLGLAHLADSVLDRISLGELVDAIERSAFVLCNDSGPLHIAASLQRPTIALFGPTNADWFRPWGDIHLVVQRDICPWRPCFDYCKFPEPYCMTHLQPCSVWPEIHAHIEKLLQRQLLPGHLRLP